MLDAETNRADSAERKIQVITQDKAQSEYDLGRRIADLEQSLFQRETDLGQLRDDLETEKQQRISEAGLARSLAQEKEQSESSFQSVISELRERLTTVQEEYASATASLEDKESEILSLEKGLAESAAEREKAKEDISANQVLFDTTTARLNQTLTEATATRSALEESLAALQHKNLEYAEQLAQANRDNEQTVQQVHSLSGEVDRAKETLGRNEEVIVTLRENLADTVREKESTEARVKTDLDSYKTTFIRLKHDLDETLASRRTLEKELAASKMQNSAFTEELAQANRTRDQSMQKIRALSDELGQVRADLDAERKAHQTTDKDRAAIEMNRRRFEEDLRAASEEQKSLVAHLENEQRLRQAAEEKIHAAALEEERLREELRAVTEEHGHLEQDRAQKIQTLKKDLETVCELQKSLEEEVSILSQEKSKAEQKVQALTAELDQARAALADEWEHHMTSDEQLAAAVLERQKLQESLSQPDLQARCEESVLEIVTQKPDLPVIVDTASRLMELADSGPSTGTGEPQSPGIEPSPGPGTGTSDTALRNMNFSEIEDLFEEDESPGQPVQDTGSSEMENGMRFPEASAAPGSIEEEVGGVDLDYEETVAEEPVHDTGSHEIGTGTEFPEAAATPDIVEEKAGDVDLGYEETGVEEPVQDTVVPDAIHTSIPQPLFSFNRRQWLNLIKWAHHSEALSREQKAQILRMGRLIQKNRRLTREQEDQVNEMIALVQALGYRPV